MDSDGDDLLSADNCYNAIKPSGAYLCVSSIPDNVVGSETILYDRFRLKDSIIFRHA